MCNLFYFFKWHVQCIPVWLCWLQTACRAIKVYTESTWLVWCDGVFPRQPSDPTFLVKFIPVPFFIWSNWLWHPLVHKRSHWKQWLVWLDGVFLRQRGGQFSLLNVFGMSLFCQKCSWACFCHEKRWHRKYFCLSGAMVCFRGNGVAWAAWDDLLYAIVALLTSGPIHQLPSGHWFRDGQDGFAKKFDDFKTSLMI